MSDKPKIYGTCTAGCLWETVHKSDFEKSAAYIKQYPDTSGHYVLEMGKTYLLNRTGSSTLIGTWQVTPVHLGNPDYGISKAGAVEFGDDYDKYNTIYKVRVLDCAWVPYVNGSGFNGNIVYEINGEQTTASFSDGADYLVDSAFAVIHVLESAVSEVLMVNEHAEIRAKDAYEIAVEEGFEGTREEWLESLKKGPQGPQGYTPVKGVDYYTESDKAEFSEYIASELAKRGQLKPEFANDVSECTDTTKLYVLPDGYIYGYMTKKGIIYHAGENKFVASEATLNKRMGSSSLSAQDGFVWTGAIPVDLTKESPFRIKVEGTKITEDTSTYQKIWLCADNTGTTKLSAGVLVVGQNGGNFTTISSDGVIHADYKAGAKLSDDIITGTKYIRICFKFSDSAIASTSELSGVKITFPHETYTETVETVGWQNTGHAFVPADYEERIADIEKDVAILKEKAEDESNSGNSNEIVIPSFWESAVNSCVAKIKALQSGRNTVTFAFFSDNHQNTAHIGSLIGKVMQECNIPYCIFGGDAIDSGTLANETAMINNDKAFDEAMSMIPVAQMCRAVGNHDGYWVDGSEEKHRYSRAQIYDLFLRQESIAQNKYYGGDGTFYYVDDLASETRFVVCNTNYNVNTATETLDSEQIAWLTDVIFATENKSKTLVFVSHQPITNNHHSNIYADTAHAIQNLLTAKINEGWNVVGWFSGHIHADRIYQTDHTSNTEANDQTTVSLPWKTVTIRADHTGLCRDEDLIHAIGNDNQSHAIDFVTVNKNTKTVNLTRLGIGNDRGFTY